MEAMMSDAVDLHGPLAHLEDDHDLIENLARYSEGLLSKEAVKTKHRLADNVWRQMGKNDRLVELIEDAKLRRIRTGLAKREKSQILVTKAPDVLSGIMLDTGASPKHRIDSAKVLDQFATPPGQAAGGDANRFIISIDISAGGGNPETDIIHFNKPLAVGPTDDHDNIDPATMAAIAAKKDTDGGQGHL
jgi:hypothetical protein